MPVDAERLCAKGAYEAQCTRASLQDDLAAIDAVRTRIQAERKRWMTAGIVSLLAFPLLLVAAAITGEPVFTWTGIACLAAGIGLLVFASKKNAGILKHAQREQTMAAIAEVLRHDSAADAPLDIRLNFVERRKLLIENLWPARKKGKQRFYEDPWLTLETTLLDGTRVSETVTDLIRERTYVNPRGKRKTKTRTHHIVVAPIPIRSRSLRRCQRSRRQPRIPNRDAGFGPPPRRSRSRPAPLS